MSGDRDKHRRVAFESPSLRTVLVTERLTLRPPRSSDVGPYLAALRRNEAHLRPWSPLRTGPDRRPTLASVSRDVAVARTSWKRDESYTFLVTESDDRARTVVGRLTLGRVIRGPFQNAFLGYWVDAAVQGRGIMTEAVNAVVAFAFGPLALHRVQASIMPRNVASVRVITKAGFRSEGRSARYLQIAGKWEDHDIFALTREEWSSPTTIP